MDDTGQIIDADAVDYAALTAELISAYVSNNHVSLAELPALIATMHAALTGLSRSKEASGAAVEKLTPAQIKKSISHDALISFEDGKPYKTLRRHLTLRGFTPEAYRAKWGLDPDYPMTAESYSAQRSELARSLGLGQQRRKGAPAAPVAQAPATSPKKRGRPKKSTEVSAAE